MKNDQTRTQANWGIAKGSSPEVIKHFSCSTQLSTKFELLLKTKLPTTEGL